MERINKQEELQQREWYKICQEEAEAEQNRIDRTMVSKYPKCPDCGAEVYLMPPEIPQIDESKWVECTKCNWSVKFEEDTEDFTAEEIEELESQLLSMSIEQLEFAKDNICPNKELFCGDYDVDDMENKAVLLKNKVLYPTVAMQNTFIKMVVSAKKMMMEFDMENEDKIADKYNQIVEAHPEGITTTELAELIKSEYTIEYLYHVAKKTMGYIDNMAICAEVEYVEDEEMFTVRFSENDKKIEIKLVEAIDFKFIYNTSFFDAMKATLMYKLVYDILV